MSMPGSPRHVVEAGRPAPDAVPLGDIAQLLFVAADQDRLGDDGCPVVEEHPALLPDAQQGADQMLPVAHPTGNAVHGNVDDLARHRRPFGGVAVCPGFMGLEWESTFPRLGWPGNLGQVRAGSGVTAG